FTQGDQIQSHSGQGLTVTRVEPKDGLLLYHGIDSGGATTTLAESELDNFMQLSRPTERLFAGQIDADKWFELRYQTWQQNSQLSHSELRGLTGCRTSLIPHQLYIAHEVANRYAPRVLLADEVGLGKTIEAGLILHHQLLTGRAQRVLIVVPESLLHQWLVEMLRRFNLHFSLFDTKRCEEMLSTDPEQNPFLTEQLVLCSLPFLRDHPQYYSSALQGEWDLLVVDEAHHLTWTPVHASPEYELIAALAQQTTGALLLTATPEQLGKESHFARLRLLDPERFPDFEVFLQEEQSYEPIADAVQALLEHGVLDAANWQVLQDTVGEGDNRELIERLQSNPDDEQARHDLLEHLLDRHGTGRVLFRNTRTAVKGFPGRALTAYPLPAPAAYDADILTALLPEQAYRKRDDYGIPWTQVDPRIGWLIETIKAMRSEKLLIITATADTALDIAEALRVKTGIHAAVFHEGMTIIERDRAAAYFADLEFGSPLLICSEIGSEGRNFQFAHHLLLFDLPLNPDLLEQRIGRLDRIGQTQAIQIHVPYLQNSVQEILLRWYHEGLGAFEHPCPAGHAVYAEVEALLQDVVQQNSDADELVAQTKAIHHALNEQLHKGRDRLLEYNSCRPALAEALTEQALAEDANSTLADYMEAVFDCFGAASEPHSEQATIVRPAENMIAPFPLLPDEGLTLTYDRNTALAVEDIHFLTWEHAMVIGAMEMVLDNELGNTAVTAINLAKVKPGTLLLESLFVLESPQQTSRYLPPTTVRVLLDEKGKDLASLVSHGAMKALKTRVDKKTAVKIVRARAEQLQDLVRQSEDQAAAQLDAIMQQASARSTHLLNEEIHRLEALRLVNPNVRTGEIEFFQRELQDLTHLIESLRLRLDGLRVIVAT
ncbi:MAG: RNA polymerase-associated protein RapA, partial [Pseudomonadales bacterium]